MTTTVTKEDMKKIAYAHPNYHLGAIFQEIIEIYEDGKNYSLNELLFIGGERVIKDNLPIYISEEDYKKNKECYNKKSTPLKKVGNMYELIPRRVFKYEQYLKPLFYSAVICSGVTDKRVIVMVTEKTHRSCNNIKNVNGTSWDGATDKQKSEATHILNNNTW